MAASTMLSFAQDDNSSKYSSSTLMFLSEQRGEIELPKISKGGLPTQIATPPPFGAKELSEMKTFGKRKIAEAETVNGVQMISAFIAVNNNDFSGLESLGVVFQAKFNNLATTLIPVDKIEQVAALSNVTRIEVAEILEPVNDKQRSVTQAIDALTNSSAAQALGLTSAYTGKGVILGIIDTGVDFTHIAFKDKNGNSRIVRAYKLSGTNGALTTYSTAAQIAALTYDTNAEDHGTHTSTTAGGSSVIVNGNTVTVTDDHANATYGGMAPEADLVISALSSLYTTSIATSIQNICNYADQVGKPCVISLSLGSQVGAHDGTGSVAQIVNQYAGNNHIIVYAASNDGMRADAFVDLGTSNGGGMYASGTSTSSKPMIVNVQRSFSNADGNVEMLMPTITAYARTAGVATALKFHVVNVKTGAIVYSSSAYTSNTTISVTGTTGLAQYFKCPSTSYTNQYGDAGAIRIVRSQDSYNNKYFWQIYAPIMLSTSYSDPDGDGVYNSDYAFCVSVYPTSTTASTIVDMWESYASWFGQDLNLSSTAYNYCKGNDDCSVSDNACYAKAISVGAYVTKNSIKDYAGTTHDFSDEYPNIGDHASFSSWQTAGYGPLGTALPTINAPGARIVAGVNHYHTASVDDYSYYGSTYKTDLVVNSTSSPYAAMEGTSMATPCVSGIIAQWLQACVEVGKTPTPDYIKEVMAATWDTDEWTNGTGRGAHGAKTFGTHGKINAIKGLQYILGASAGPTITTTPKEVAFEGYVGDTYTETINVKGVSLTGNITASISGNRAFTIDKTSIKQSNGEASADITVTWKPTSAEAQQATLTLTSNGADDATVSITGTVLVPELIADPETITFTAEAGLTATGSFSVLGADLKGDVTATLNDANGVFSLSTTTVTKADAEEGKAIDVTFAPTAVGSYPATVTLSSPGVDDITITLSGTATTPIPTLTASDDILTFEAIKGETDTQTVNISGRFLSEDINVAVEGTGFSVSPTTISNADVQGESGKDITVTFTAPKTTGDYEGTITLTSAGAETVTINLIATSKPRQTTKTIYQLTNTLTAGGEYLIVSRNSAGSGYALGHSNATVASDGVTVKARDELSSAAYIESDDVDATSVWTVASGYTFKNGSYYVGVTTSGTRSLRINTSSTNWTWSGTNNRLSYKTTSGRTSTTYYLRYSNDFSVSTSASSIYLYKKTTVTVDEVDPEIIADPEEIEYSTNVGTPVTKSFDVLASNLQDDITVTIDDENGVFSADAETITIAEAEEGKTVSVTFTPTTGGTFTGTVTLSSKNAEDVVVSLTATAKLIGDVDRNGVVDLADVKALVEIILGKATRENDAEKYDFDAADVNTDDNITIADVTALVNTILGK